MKVRIEVSSLATPSISGVGHYVRRLSRALDADRNNTVYAAYFNFLGRQVTPNLTLRRPLDQNRFIPLRVYAKLQSFGISFPFDIFKSPVDLTIFPNFATWPTIQSKLRATVVHDLTYLYYPELMEDKNLAHLRRVVPRSIKKADFIITVSESVRQELIKEFSLDPARCIATPIPPEEMFYKKSDNDIHTKYNIPTKKYIYFIGTLEPRKNLSTLVEAYQQLPQNLKDEYSLVLAGGKGWKGEKSQAAIDKAQAAGDRVIHIGYIDQADSPVLFQKASLYVMPSLYEGFGMPVLEAMISQTPVIASDIPVLREAGGEAALYASPKDPGDFSKKMEAILASPQTAAELNKKAKAQVEKFSWEDNANKIIGCAEEILGNS